MYKSLTYRLKPTNQQALRLEQILNEQRLLYNACLQERSDAYRLKKESLSYYDQAKELVIWRQDEQLNIPSNLQRGTLKRVDLAFKAFFKRVKNKGGKAGYPRFKSKERYHSFNFVEFVGITIVNKKIKFKSMPGKIKVHFYDDSLLTNIDNIKSCVFIKDHKGWKICFQVYFPDIPKITEVINPVGIDVGIKNLVTLSNGEFIENVKPYDKHQKKLRVKQRALARCKRNSNRRKKVKSEVVKMHHKIKNIRQTNLHAISKQIVDLHDLISMEDLQINNMVKNHRLAKAINDCSWSKLMTYIAYKAENAGKCVVKVNPRNTSRTCSNCGHIQDMKLSDRIYECEHCESILDRDVNAAVNILNRGLLKFNSTFDKKDVDRVVMYPETHNHNVGCDVFRINK